MGSPRCSVTAGLYRIAQGWIFLAASEQGVARVVLPRASREAALAAAGWKGPLSDTPGLRRLARKIARYYEGAQVRFSEPVDLGRIGPFGRAVLRATRAIPRGAVRTYGEVARRVGRPRAARAVGQALHRNPVPLLVPCHRVIGAGGRLVGFGSGIGEKQRLLRLEGAWPRKKA
jgi:methylated-DNA-[protein]-cysteine S-methyltransferase